ncbi:polyprenyl synthetase family protein [Streptomyces sp. PTY087I2]|uniref:polyprenyl synthetase family protein n=1 Tax=Streptomyces sp. PTY087I2 TaxID=1819298 RepID=UPI00080BE8AC|nr:polyprenyl synthetase family protein [Streptomyces sp. PTY087I2]OCC09733.1 Farnesyl diphosphate synthase [Streptomyces sp. PTY087I2]
MTGALLTAGDALPAPMAAPDVLQQRIDRTVQRLDHHIDRLCPRAPAQARAAWLPLGHPVETEPADAPSLDDRLHRALSAPVRHLTDAAGRRWRPAMIWETVGLLGGDSEHCGPLIAATELLHTGSLMVDDVQDASPLRRGKPAAHTVFGTPTALNAGTAAYFLWDRAVELTYPDDVRRGGDLRALLLTALRAGHAGQALDLQGHREEMDRAVARGDRDVVLNVVRLTHRLKSGAPVSAGMEMAAVVTGAAPELRAALVAFGSAVGTAYQIADDIADLRGVTRAGQPTKQAAEDLRNGKVTMPLAHAVGRLPQSCLERLWHRIGEGSLDDEEVGRAREQLEDCGAVRAGREEADHMVRDAWDRLAPLLPRPNRHLLLDLALLIVRSKQVA